MNTENMRRHAEKVGNVLKLGPDGEATCSSSQTAFILLEALAITLARDNRFVRVPTSSGAVMQLCEQRGGDRMVIIMQFPDGLAFLLSQDTQNFRQADPDLFATYRRHADEVRQSDLLKSGISASAIGSRVDIVRPEFHFAAHNDATTFLMALGALLPAPSRPGVMRLAESDERRIAWRKLAEDAWLVMLDRKNDEQAWFGTMTRAEFQQLLPGAIESDANDTETLH